MKRNTKAKIKDKAVNITIELLEYLYNIGGTTFDAVISKKAAYKIFKQNFYKQYTEVPFTKWLYRLRDQGYLKYSTDSDSVEFTTKSKLKLIDRVKLVSDELDQFHFISFDIPEYRRSARAYFRRAIKSLGFKQVQASLWVINKDVYELVQEFARELNVEKYIANIISAKSDIDGIIDKMLIK